VTFYIWEYSYLSTQVYVTTPEIQNQPWISKVSAINIIIIYCW